MVELTQAVQLLADTKLDLHNQLDNDLFNHISFVVNRSLILLRDDGLTEQTKIQIGKYLWRLIRVLQAYNHKRQEVTLQEVLNIASKFKEVFV